MLTQSRKFQEIYNKKLKTVTNENDRETPKERYISPEEKRKLIDNLIITYSIILEYQKITNLLDNILNQRTKFRAKDGVEINDNARGTYNKKKPSMLKSSLCDYSDAYILAKGNISIESKEGGNVNNGDQEEVFKNSDPFTDCISEINNTEIDNNKDIDVVMPICNLIKYGYNFWKTSGSLWLYYRDEPALANGDAISKFHTAINSPLFKFKQKITGKTAANGLKGVEIMVPVKD